MNDQQTDEVDSPEQETSFLQALVPVLILLTLIVYGLIVRPHWLGLSALPLEIIFILAAALTVGFLVMLGHRWQDIQATIVEKLSRAMPAFFILFCIGLVIASWIVSGTIPMMVYWGLQLIDPNYLYLVAFVAPIIFSTLTGTSWGSAGTIGVVLIGIAAALDANMGITAGAVIGGAYFGDKLSPLSDTTNLAALAADVPLFDHIHSMMFTTLPSALLAGLVYMLAGWWYPPAVSNADMSSVEPFLAGLSEIFTFHWILLLPPAIVLIGSLRRMPTVPILITSVLVASIMGMTIQSFSVGDVFQSVYKGFDVSMASWVADSPESVKELLNRGGLYSLNDAIITAFMVFVFVGAMEHIRAMPTVVNALLKLVSSVPLTILSTLAASAMTNAMTSNQFATSFIVGDAFKSKYDKLKIPRKVLSRSLEDTGTMLESLVPWSPCTVYMVATLGVPFADYWQWQVLSMFNIVVACGLAVTGIGCFLEQSPISVDAANTSDLESGPAESA